MDCSKKGVRNWMAAHSSRIWAAVLLGVGLLLYFLQSVGGIHSFGEFLMLAGGLTVTVDPFLKRRLQQEAAEDIFHHLLGLDLPLEIRESLKDFLLRNDYYRKDVDIEINVRTLPGTPEVEVLVALSAIVVCIRKMKYCQHVSFEESENGTIIEASVTSISEPGKSYAVPDLELKPNAEEPMVWDWTGDPVRLKTGEQVTTFLRYKMRKPIRDFHALFFGSSVIHPRVRLYGSDDLEVTASKADQVNGNEHIYEKVFVEGDHFQIRWKPKGVPNSAR